jgi:hypothetical protein
MRFGGLILSIGLAISFETMLWPHLSTALIERAGVRGADADSTSSVQAQEIPFNWLKFYLYRQTSSRR